MKEQTFLIFQDTGLRYSWMILSNFRGKLWSAERENAHGDREDI
jgi:hypothetical protein